MRNKALLCLGIALVLSAMLATAQTPQQGGVQKQATISKAEASKIALARVPNGTIKEAELEKEKGKLVWSFDISAPNTKTITEVLVDAKSGKVVSVTQESPAEEAAEKKAEPHKK